MRVLLISVLTTVSLGVLLVIGLRIPPRPFEPASVDPDAGSAPVVPIPEGLPEPVDRFARILYPAGVPLIDSAVVSGRARMRIAGVAFPARFRFTHDVGRGYRHEIEATIFGMPVLRVNETYLDGRARLELPFGVTEGEPKVDQAATLGLWAESIWWPSVYFSDERVGWQAVDGASAILLVPGPDGGERFVVRFDPTTGLPHLFSSMRYKGADDAHKTLWLNEIVAWGTRTGRPTPGVAALTWFDEGSPWAVFHVDEVVHGVDVTDSLQPSGR